MEAIITCAAVSLTLLAHNPYETPYRALVAAVFAGFFAIVGGAALLAKVWNTVAFVVASYIPEREEPPAEERPIYPIARIDHDYLQDGLCCTIVGVCVSCYDLMLEAMIESLRDRRFGL
ncbi:hypothetical protein FZEAL_361 [Fusarium zealandicum]|uniref:Uncharacterized protein n=1 Tax=Fusarium zealandicum TaxID=1053134 RepID=A0A8H4UUV5_9HYPO|nr:hypothetical protein FZEAL_361 [Fusarium zealandicum]